MLRMSIVVAVAVAGMAQAQQPVPPRPAGGDCPVIVVDGQRITTAGSDCVVRPNARPDWTTPPPAADPLARFLYPPELVMAHQEAIGLTDKQRAAIQDAVKDAQSKVVDLQFRMSAEVEKLQRLIQSSSPDEPKVLDEVTRVLTLERDMKVTQMTLMIRIKSQLTERQQGMLDQLRSGTPKPIRD
jgi:Spy/CpxP family protein refolding chaperone